MLTAADLELAAVKQAAQKARDAADGKSTVSENATAQQTLTDMAHRPMLASLVMPEEIFLGLLQDAERRASAIHNEIDQNIPEAFADGSVGLGRAPQPVLDARGEVEAAKQRIQEAAAARDPEQLTDIEHALGKALGTAHGLAKDGVAAAENKFHVIGQKLRDSMTTGAPIASPDPKVMGAFFAGATALAIACGLGGLQEPKRDVTQA